MDNVRLGPSNIPQQYCQNSRLQITGIRVGPAGGGTVTNCGNSGSDRLNLSFTYPSAGNNGNPTAERIVTNDAAPLDLTQQFAYDAYNRLALAVETPTASNPAVSANPASPADCSGLSLTGNPWCQRYGYDAAGNRWVSNWASGGSGFVASTFTPTSAAWYTNTNRLSTAASGIQYDSGAAAGAGNATNSGYNLLNNANCSIDPAEGSRRIWNGPQRRK